MLNYIWLGIIIIALLVGIGKDVYDVIENPYRNNIPLEVIFIPDAINSNQEEMTGTILLSSEKFNNFYGTSNQQKEIIQKAVLNLPKNTNKNFIIRLNDESPQLWNFMAINNSDKNKLAGQILNIEHIGNGSDYKLKIIFEPIRFIKLKAITKSAIDFVNTAVEISIGLIGVMALWLGLIKIAEESGLIKIFTRALTPITKKIFPDVPSDHPAIGAIIMNTAANMLGLSNAATPIGLKAMEELNKLNPKVGTATNSMVTFLTINTGGLILIPATAMAVRASLGSNNIGIIIGTSIFAAGCATITGVVMSKILQRWKMFAVDKQIEK